MLSYRHSYHAGNHADVIKHITQMLIIESLKNKDKPFIYHDTHSGAGRYDLLGAHSEKTGEYKQGIGLIWQREDAPALIKPYIDIVKQLNPNGELQFYYGSPKLGRTLLRPQDRATFTELHSTDFPLLAQEFHRDRQVTIYNEDGYARLKASLPPKERRGLVLIDPSYEIKTEYQTVVDSVCESIKRWATGIYAIWYPVVQRENIDKMLHQLEHSGIRKILQIELGVAPDSDERGMSASGMIVINPPWLLEKQMQEILPWLQSIIAPKTGHQFIKWVVPE